MEIEYLSQKQIADKLGVTKQRVYRCIKANHIKEAVTEVVKGNKVLMYDEQAINQIKSLLEDNNNTSEVHHAEVHREAHHETVEAHREVHNEVLYDAVLKQLDILNEQLKAKDKQIENLSQALDQAQKLHAMDRQKIMALEDKMAEAEKESKEVVIQEQTEETKKSWWNIFGKKA